MPPVVTFLFSPRDHIALYFTALVPSEASILAYSGIFKSPSQTHKFA